MRLAVCLVAALSAAVSAQGARADDRSPGSITPPADWSGPYAGGYVGFGTSSGRTVLDSSSGQLIPVDVEYGLFPRSIKGNKTGAVGGLGAGYNLQSGAFVSGVEADIGYAGVSPHHHYSRVDNVPTSPFPGVHTNTNFRSEFGFLGTLRARGGYAFGDTLVFGTAGLAAGQVRNRFDLAMLDPNSGAAVYQSPDWNGSGTRFGYAVGFGVEHRIRNGMSLRFETLYVNLADRTVHGIDPVAFAGESISYRFRNELVTARFGISVRF